MDCSNYRLLARRVINGKIIQISIDDENGEIRDIWVERGTWNIAKLIVSDVILLNNDEIREFKKERELLFGPEPDGLPPEYEPIPGTLIETRKPDERVFLIVFSVLLTMLIFMIPVVCMTGI